MKDKLSKEDNKDLPIEVINVDIHNKALFMFLSMLKCSKMGNYKLRDSAYLARESCYKETPFFDAVWVDPKDNSDFLFIEVKTRMVGDYEVNYEDRITKDVVSKVKGLINNDMDISTTGYKFIVPVFIYKKEHRAYNKLGYANLLVIWGDKNFYCVSAVNTIEHWSWFFSDQHDIEDLFFSLEEIPHYQGTYIISRKKESSKPVLNVEQYLEDKDPEQEEQEEQEEPQAASDVPMINKHYKNSYIFYKYSEYVFNINEFYTLLYKSQLWKGKRSAIKSNIVRSLASHINKDLIDLVIECDGELMTIHKECTNYKNGKHSFNSETKLFIKRCTKLIIFKKTSLASAAKIADENKEEYERFSNYMDSINTDDIGTLSDSA